MATSSGYSGPDRRAKSTNKLVVVDLTTVFPDWTGPVPPSELVARSTLVRTLAEARRDGDVYLVGAPVSLAWSARQVFEGSAVVIESDDPNIEKELSGEFLDLEKTGKFGELVIVSSDRRFLDVIRNFRDEGRDIRVVSNWVDSDVVMNGEANVTAFFPDMSGV